MLNHRTSNKKAAEIVYGRNLYDNNFSILGLNSDCIFIDGLDEAKNPSKVINHLATKGYRKLICTARQTEPHNYFRHVIKLNPLTHEQIIRFFKMIGLDNRSFHSLTASQFINSRVATPRDLLSLAISDIDSSNLKEFYSRYDKFLYQFGNGVDFGSYSLIQANNLVVPSRDIIKNVTIINDTLLKKAKDNPGIIHNFTSREFEEMVCDFLDKQGYYVKLTKQTRDGGKDIIVVQKSILGEFSIYVECKKYDVNRPISVSLIRELYGTVMTDAVTAGMLITTSYFTKDAKEYTDKIKHRMTLMDYTELVKALNTINI